MQPHTDKVFYKKQRLNKTHTHKYGRRTVIRVKSLFPSRHYMFHVITLSRTRVLIKDIYITNILHTFCHLRIEKVCGETPEALINPHSTNWNLNE